MTLEFQKIFKGTQIIGTFVRSIPTGDKVQWRKYFHLGARTCRKHSAFSSVSPCRDSITCQAGSYYYMAPEMLKGQPYDFKCDVWSMGVVLYEMITNELPFPATSQSEIIELVCNAKPRPLSNEMSDNVVNLISKMLRKGAPYRPRTNQLVLCPYLVPFIIRVYLNLGRSTNVANRDPDSFGPDIFLSFLKPQQINY